MSESRHADLLSRVRSASLVDAMGRTHSHRSHILDLVTPVPGRVLFGSAATISFVPVRRDLLDDKIHNFARQFYEAVGDAPRGKVLVMASNGHPEASLGGGTKLSRLHNHRLAGVLCDGRLRDFDELADYDFATYCTGMTTRWGDDVIMPFEAGVPVVIERVTVIPGDYIYADQIGAVVIPAQDLEVVLIEAVRIEEADARWIEKIRREDPKQVRRSGSQEQ